MFVSVIIPTYNRKELLRQTILSLEGQTLPPEEYEVIIVDDGSDDSTQEAVSAWAFPFLLKCYRRQNQGAIAARNFGARQAQGDVLVFLDDDIVVVPEFLSEIVRCHHEFQRVVAVGSLRPYPRRKMTPFERVYTSEDSQSDVIELLGEGSSCALISYTHCLSGIFSVRKADYFEIGMMESLGEQGRDAWGDVDFGYRAAQKGFRILRLLRAIGYHNDSLLASLEARCRAERAAARYTVLLFNKHPELEGEIAMFHDKGYISWRDDPPNIILRKLARSIMILPLALWTLEGTVRIVERLCPSPALLCPLYRWVTGTYICLGYREGLKTRHG